ncbi:LysR family transcriptional regulator [bacterium]|nr:LysR family transcriptional regulator [bacterium]
MNDSVNLEGQMEKRVNNFNHLYNFYLIGRSGTLSKAAQIQGVSKASLSSQMKKFESSTEIKLFDRSSKKLSLTPDGQMIYAYAERMFETANIMEKNIATAKKRTGKKTIGFGITSSISQSYSVMALAPVLKSKTIVPLIKEGILKNLIDEIFKRNIDIIIHEDQYNQSFHKGLESELIGENKYSIVGTKKYKNLIKGFPNSLDQVDFFSLNIGHSVRAKLDTFFVENNIFVNVYGEANGIDLIREATLSGHCISALPNWTIEKYITSGELFVIGDIKDNSEKIYATYRAKDNIEKLQNVLEILKR